MKRFIREMLPDPVGFYEAEGLTLKGPGKWKTTRCDWHGGSDSMRINSETGAFKCMACEVRGGDVLAFYMQRHGIEFIDAAEALGATVEDGAQYRPTRKPAISASAGLKLIQHEAWFIACTALAAAEFVPDPADRARLIEASRAIQGVMQEVLS